MFVLNILKACASYSKFGRWYDVSHRSVAISSAVIVQMYIEDPLKMPPIPPSSQPALAMLNHQLPCSFCTLMYCQGVKKKRKLRVVRYIDNVC